MAVLQLMNNVQSEPVGIGETMEVRSFGTGFITKALALKRFNANHHRKLDYLVKNGWLHMWREQTGRKYFALTPAGKGNLDEKIHYAKACSFKTGIPWRDWCANKEYRADTVLEKTG